MYELSSLLHVFRSGVVFVSHNVLFCVALHGASFQLISVFCVIICVVMKCSAKADFIRDEVLRLMSYKL